MLNWNRISAVFGGTFDPPHLGHREAVRGLFQNPGVQRVIVIPTGNPAFKNSPTPALHRLEMARINFSPTALEPDYPKEIEINSIEMPSASSEVSSASYTYNTLVRLKAQHSTPLAWVIGTDQLSQLHRWHRFPEVLSLCHWIVLSRKGISAPETQITLSQWMQGGLLQPQDDSTFLISNGQKTLKIVTTPAPECSSTMIREQFSRPSPGSSGNLLSEVEEYLKRHALYGN